jgi:hypothetical protein
MTAFMGTLILALGIGTALVGHGTGQAPEGNPSAVARGTHSAIQALEAGVLADKVDVKAGNCGIRMDGLCTRGLV